MQYDISALERQAADASRRGDMPSAERVCREILSRKADHLPSLRFLSDLAFNGADFAAAEPLLRKLIELNPRDGGLYSRLGQALYQQGRLEEALEPYRDYQRLNPKNAMVYLSLGCLYLELGDSERAAQAFSLGESVDRKLLHLWEEEGANPQLSQMSKSAWECLKEHHTQLHLDAVDEGAGTERIRGAVWPLLDARETSYQHDKQRAQVFYFDLPKTPPFYDTAEMPWVETLEAEFPALRDEIINGLDLASDGRPYLGDGHQLEGEQWLGVVNSMNWASVHLYSGGIANKNAVLQKFPKTLAALEQVPLATHRGNPAEVFISVLAPETTIPAHYGVSSANLTVHLPIVVPGDCGLWAGNESRVPEEGVVMAFDDTWEHGAWNKTGEQRVVLIFEVWNPQLSKAEQDAILASFYAREDWLKRRSV